MKDKLITGVVVAIIACAAGVFATTAVHALWFAPEEEAEAPALAKSALSRNVSPEDKPARLRIPSLKIDAAVQNVGITKKGTMAVPSNYTDVAWYKYGPVPGQVGSAVIDGHIDNGLALDGVFKHLNQLKAGDDIFVDTKKGTALHFVVVATKIYNYRDAPTDLIFNRKDTARLNLITCEGTWVQSDKTYDHRLVVYTVLVDD